MFERLTSTVLQQALQEYFVLDGKDNVMDVWSGFVRWNQMELRKEWLNEKIQAKGLPFEIVHGYVNLLTVSIPWSKLGFSKRTAKDGSTTGTIVVVLDGVQLLVRTNYEFDDDAFGRARIKSRRNKLHASDTSDKALSNNASFSSSWRESLKQRLKEGILPQIADNLQLHIRDLHIRIEDIASAPNRPMGIGIVLESMHLQHSESPQGDPTFVQKESQVNHFAIYANALDTDEEGKPSERSILQNVSKKTIIEILDRSIPRRANSLEATARMAPQHTYILSPVDTTATVQSGTDPSVLVAMNRPVLSITIQIPNVQMALQDVHCHAGLAWYYKFQDHKYRARYRPFRPRKPVQEDPRAWWQYAATAIQHELQQSRLHWSWRRFQKRFLIRKRYCDLYERRLRADISDGAENGHTPASLPLSAAESEELESIEDGLTGQLAVEDILLFRAIVWTRVGDAFLQRRTTKRKLLSSKSSWLQRTFSGMVKDDSAANDEFQRAMDLWEQAKKRQATPLEESSTWVALSVVFVVQKGVFSVYTPLSSTIDQRAFKRLQVHFLSFVFNNFCAQGRLLGDFDSIRLETSLQDFHAEEERSDRSRHTVIARNDTESLRCLPEAFPTPLLKFQFIKNSRLTNDFHVGIHAEMQKLSITLEPSCEWILNGRSLIRPLPRFTKLKEFWDDVGMNFINTMKTNKHGIFAKAETAVADHKSIDIDIWIDCPILRVLGCDSLWIDMDFGQARVRTERLAGVAKSKLISTLKDEAIRLSSFEEPSGLAENSLEFLRTSSAVNDSMRSTQFNDMVDGIQVFRDDMTALDRLAHTPPDRLSGIESFFYDAYVANLKSGSAQIRGLGESLDILDPIELRTTLHRSIIPRDATLFRYKVMFSIGDIVVKLTEEKMADLRRITSTWNSVLKATYADAKEEVSIPVHSAKVGLHLDPTRSTEETNDGVTSVNGHPSDFDEDEFFDTMDHESAFSDFHGDDNFMAESESVLDSDSQSLARSVRSRRKRQSSVSDVSSISDGSGPKRRGGAEHPYLSAENLARLEENVNEDSADDFDEGEDIDEVSFQSAISASQLLHLIQNLEDDIRATKSNLSRLRNKLAELRSPGGAGNFGDKSQRIKLRDALQLEVERIQAELMAMAATRDDLKSRVGAGPSGSVSVSRDANRSVEVASILLQTRKKRGSASVEHSLAGNSSRSILQLSGFVESLTIRFDFVRGRERRPCHFWARIGTTSIVLLTKTGENKLFFSEESLSAGINENGSDKSQHIFVGGNIEDYGADLLTSRFPHIVPPSALDEKLLRIAITLAKARSQSQMCPQSRLVRLRVAVGEFQVAPRPWYMQEAKAFITGWGTKKGNGDPVQITTSNKAVGSLSLPVYFDILVSLSSAKILDAEGGFVAGVIGDLTSRFSGAVTSEIDRERAQLDIRCGSLQILHLGQGKLGQPIELLRKQDTFSNVFRLRVRAQKALSPDSPGWVLGHSLQVNVSCEEEAKENAIRHINASMQIEPLSIISSPEVVQTLLHTKTLWQVPQVRKLSRGNEGMSKLTFGVTLRRATIVVASNIHDLTSEDSTTAGRKLLVGFAFNSEVYSDQTVPDSLSARGKAIEVTLRFLNDKMPFLHPFSVSFLIDKLSPNTPVAHRERCGSPVPDTVGTIEHQTPEFPSVENAELLITFLGSPFHLCVNPKTVSFVVGVLTHLIECMKASRSLSQPEHEGSTSSGGAKKIVLRTRFERFHVSFFEHINALLPRSSGPLFVVGVEKIMAIVQKQEQRASIWSRVAEIESIDYSIRRGVKSLGCSASGKKASNNIAGQMPECDRAMVELDASLERSGEKIVGNVKVSLCQVQILVLPSLVRSVLTFRRDLSAALPTKTMKPATTGGREIGRLFDIQISMGLDSLELLVPTRDVPGSIREGNTEDIGVVSVRCGIEFRNYSSSDDFAKLMAVDGFQDLTFDNVKISLEEFVSRRMKYTKTGHVINMSTELMVRDFQVLRTAMRVPSTDPIAFHTAGSTSREQRVTNSFCLACHHELAGTLFEKDSDQAGLSRRISISHALDVRAEFVDLLVYIARSDRGINTAIEATIRPIFTVLQNVKTTRATESPNHTRISLLRLLTASATIASFRLEGVQVTCVPGGATRLTESPIIKFTLFRIAAGCGVTGQSAPPGIQLVSSTELDHMNTGGVPEFRHLLLGSWLSCGISGYYHNRRLVEWEPFCEPWRFVLRVGMDLTRVLRLPAVRTDFDLLSTLEVDHSEHNASSPSPVTRFGHLSRLLRSPFGVVQDPTEVGSKSTLALSDADVCFVLLRCRVPGILETAVFQHQDLTDDDAHFQPLPGEHSAEWVVRHGYPDHPGASTLPAQPAFSFRATDEGSLDVNVTGALLDTLWQYLSKDPEKDVAPHLIQNHSGLTIRFHEVLDNDRLISGERAPKVTLESGKSAPLSLRRSLSQSCDPHKAYIMVELGTFDETVDRVERKTSFGSRSSVFSYRVASKIPVDTVGTTRYPLELCGDRSGPYKGGLGLGDLGWIIVKVRLEGGIKVVSLMSPLSLSNTSDLGLFFEIRESTGVAIIWRSFLERTSPGFSTPLPADLVSVACSRVCKLVVVALPKEMTEESKHFVDTGTANIVHHLRLPPPFSKSSLSRGMLGETNIAVQVVGTPLASTSDLRYFNVCSVRVGSIGSISLEQQGKSQRESKESTEIPEQRMLLFRSSVLFRNHLALPIELQARMVLPSRTTSVSQPNSSFIENDKERSEWIQLGRLDCGASLSWSGAAPSETLEIRIRFVEESGGAHGQFPSWSSATEVPPEDMGFSRITGARKYPLTSRTNLGDMILVDAKSRPLVISSCLRQGANLNEKSSSSLEMEDFLQQLQSSSRVVGLYVPFWIIDQTGMFLQFRAGSIIAGQETTQPDDLAQALQNTSVGLGELLDDRDMSHLPSRVPFRVHMIGDKVSSFVNARMGKNRKASTAETTWSTPIHLSRAGTAIKDTVVLGPLGNSPEALASEDIPRESFVIRSRISDAPEEYGGTYGTRFLHMVCKYVVVNSLGLDIEISSGPGKGDNPILVKADSRPRPLSFIAGRMRFRPKEFGWYWSGLFKATLSRKDVTLSIKHGLKGYSMIASVEFYPGETSGTCVIVFKNASHAPYRIENHSMFPILYYQRNAFAQGNLVKNSSSREQQDNVVLPFHSTSFAWEEPEDRWRAVGIQFADFGLLPTGMSKEFLGSFDLDRLSPGTEVELPGEGGLIGKIIAEGPTRVLRITGVSSADTFNHPSATNSRCEKKDRLLPPSVSVQIRLRKGLGLSVVDWSPQELLYIDLQDIVLETEHDKGRETTNVSVGYAAVNNQLWVTPYPVTMSIGSRSKRRRKALRCIWTRSIASDESFEGVTMLGKLEVYLEPVDVRVDGRLASLVVDMVQQMKNLYGAGQKRIAHTNRETTNGGQFDNDFLSVVDGQPDLADELYTNLDMMATSAIAAKLRHSYRPIHPKWNKRSIKRASAPAQPFLKNQHKFYIERLKVSVTSVMLSWHGSLPVASPLRPAFFFEGLPIFMSPYAASHVYGSPKDLVKGVMSHYISLRRVFDVGVGAMIHKPLFFPREILTYILSTGAGSLQVAERSVLAVAHFSLESSSSGRVYERWLLPLVTFSAAILRGGVNMLQAGSSIVRYGTITPRPTGSQPRSRNPRFFAHTDGNDLLVEYVEGENAGKALLSRVRMGAHLIEGYSFHIDDVFESRVIGGKVQMDNKNLILMVTHARVMLLRGQLDVNFCKVIWEASFSDVVYVEQSLDAGSVSHEIVTIWYIRDVRSQQDDNEDAATRTIAVGSSGLGMLHPMNVFVPRGHVRRLVEKLAEERERNRYTSHE